MEDKDRPVVRHEDDDPLVVHATRLCTPADIYRKPGLLVFKLRRSDGAEIMVKRSRFDGDYGNIVRAANLRRGAAEWEPATPVPTSHLVMAIESAVSSGDTDAVFDKAESLVTEWSQKGRNGSAQT